MIEELKKENERLKRVLESAIKVLNLYIPCDYEHNCSECIKQGRDCDYDDCFKWIYADEALKLIKKGGKTND